MRDGSSGGGRHWGITAIVRDRGRRPRARGFWKSKPPTTNRRTCSLRFGTPARFARAGSRSRVRRLLYGEGACHGDGAPSHLGNEGIASALVRDWITHVQGYPILDTRPRWAIAPRPRRYRQRMPEVSALKNDPPRAGSGTTRVRLVLEGRHSGRCTDSGDRHAMKCATRS